MPLWMQTGAEWSHVFADAFTLCQTKVNHRGALAQLSLQSSSPFLPSLLIGTCLSAVPETGPLTQMMCVSS